MQLSSHDIRVRIKTGMQSEHVRKLSDGRYEVWVSAPRKNGKANDRAGELLAQYFGVPIPEVGLRSGRTSTSKVFFLRNQPSLRHG
jgi:uncharacterized protein YggU (UPF0235/DUF167 family)